MVTAFMRCCNIPFWPMGPIFGAGVLLPLVAVVGVVFSVVMLIDCLKRPIAEFPHPITKNGEYDKLIWTTAIVASLWFYFLGAIIYFFVVKRVKSPNQPKT